MTTPIRPYGDRRDDGVIQLSFTLPVAESERSKQAALELAQKMGLQRAHVASTFFTGSVALSLGTV